ncbi:MAG: hypothetical protein QNJ98_17435 [Planctomycetota bacterium]|nr:hypothetical protein [Planctomycetota bacterium]
MDATPPDTPAPRGALYWIGTAGGVFLGGVLLVATWAKMIDPAAFIELIELEHLDFLIPAWVVAPLGLAIEAGLGLALLFNMRRMWVLLPTAGLCLFFVWLTGRAYLAYLSGDKDPASSCGCFGNLVERTPSEAFWSDLLLLVPPLILAFLGRPKVGTVPRLRLELIGATVLVVLAFTWKAPDLPLDDIATRLKPGAQLDKLCAGEGEQRTCLDHVVPEALEGRYLLLLADLEQRELRYAIARLNELTATESGTGLLMLTSADPSQIKLFKWDTGPTFEIRHAPATLLRPLYRRTPRSALVENGTVVRTYDGLPPSGAVSGGDAPEQD